METRSTQYTIVHYEDETNWSLHGIPVYDDTEPRLYPYSRIKTHILIISMSVFSLCFV